MTDPVFDKEGNLTNLDELDRDEVAAAYQEKNRSLFGRLTEEETKRKEAEANVAKAKTDLEAKEVSPPVAPAQQQTPVLDVDELRLEVGLSREEAAEAKEIAKGKGISFTEALQTPLFKLFQADREETKRKEDAKLPASKGSDQTPLVEGLKPGMTRDEHQNIFNKAIGKDTA